MKSRIEQKPPHLSKKETENNKATIDKDEFYVSTSEALGALKDNYLLALHIYTT